MSFNWYNNTPQTRFIKVDTTKHKVFRDKSMKCFNCGNDVYKEHDWCWISKCDNCRALINFFHPTPIQEVAALIKSTIIYNIGAVGSGKTTISSYILSEGLRTIPNSKLLAAAQTRDQLDRNAAPELAKFFHPDEFAKKNKDIWVLKNGSVIEFWASDNPDKLRSANANFIWLVEANSPEMKAFYNEATSRLRNQLGLVYATDEDGKIIVEKTATGQEKPVELYNRNLLLVEGNPKTGAWFNTSILQAHTILYTPNVRGIKNIKARAKPLAAFDRFSNTEKNADIVGILNASYDNPMLDRNYFINLRSGCESDAEYEQKVYCDITSQDGLVFKDVVDNINQYKTNFQGQDLWDPNWVFVETLDPGGSQTSNDPDAYLLGLFNKNTKQLKIIDCFKISGLLLEETISKIWELRNRWGWKRERLLVFTGDNVLARSNKADRGSLKQEYEIRLGCGINVCNDKAINHGISLVKYWFKQGALVLNNVLTEPLINELYTYETFQVPKKVRGSDAVVYDIAYSDVNNHLLDALRYLVVKLEEYGYRQDQFIIDERMRQMSIQEDELTVKQDPFGWLRKKFNSRNLDAPQSFDLENQKFKL